MNNLAYCLSLQKSMGGCLFSSRSGGVGAEAPRPSGVLKSAPTYLALSGLRTQHPGMFFSETTLLRASSETWMNDLDTPPQP